MIKYFKIAFNALFIIITLCFLAACDKKQYAIDNLSEFVEKVKKEAPEYTSKDWEEADREYDEIIAEIEKYDYSTKETERIAELKGKYDGIKFKDTVEDAVDGVDKVFHEVKGRAKGVINGILGNEMQSLGNEADSSGVNNN